MYGLIFYILRYTRHNDKKVLTYYYIKGMMIFVLIERHEIDPTWIRFFTTQHDHGLGRREGTHMSSRFNTKKIRTVVVAAALIAGVGAVAIPATGANFSASQSGHVNIATAKLTVSLTDDAGSSNTFNLNFSNLKPGEVQHQAFYVTNTGSIPAVAKLGQPISVATMHIGSANPALLSAGISGITSLTPVTSLPASFGLGVIQPGETKKFVLDVSLDQSAGNEWQGATIAASATVTLDQQ